MKSANKTPGARPGTEGFQDKTNSNTSPNTAKCAAGLAPTRSEPKIKLTRLVFDGVFWGWLARTDKYHFAWGFSKLQARDRLRAALKYKQETQR
jgi:hypothetical protein